MLLYATMWLNNLLSNTTFNYNIYLISILKKIRRLLKRRSFFIRRNEDTNSTNTKTLTEN
jgi:hypothetical protein